MLAQHNQAYKDAKEFNDWMPDDGKYTILITNCEKGATLKDNVPLMWWKHTAKILGGDHPELIDREFGSAYCTSNNFGMAKGQARVLNGGEVAPETSEEFDAVMMGATGKVLKVSVKTTTSKKHPGREFANCYYEEVLELADASEEQSAEPPQSAPPQNVDVPAAAEQPI